MANDQGFDASHHQGEIQFQELADSGLVTFGIYKATQGVTFVDPQFARNLSTGRQHLDHNGAYHFVSSQEDGSKQADFFAQTVGELQSGDLIPFADVEADMIGSKDGWAEIDRDTRRKRLDHFLEEADAKFGTTVGIYTAPGWWNETFGADYDHSGRPLWLAAPGNDAPGPCGQWTAVTIWQRSWKGILPGVGDGDVDLDESLLDLPLIP